MARSKKTLPTKITLETQSRSITGKKVKQLRYQGLIPANIFGPSFNSASISVNERDFTNVYKMAHETGIVYLNLGKDNIPTLIRNIQHHPVTQKILHVDFRKIDLKQKIEAAVPIELIGESAAVSQLSGVLLRQHDHLTIEALPEDIPQNIQIDISVIKNLGEEIKVKDISKSTKFLIKEDLDMVIVSVIAHREESVTPETAAAVPEVITEEKQPEEEGAPSKTEQTPEEKKG